MHPYLCMLGLIEKQMIHTIVLLTKEGKHNSSVISFYLDFHTELINEQGEMITQQLVWKNRSHVSAVTLEAA